MLRSVNPRSEACFNHFLWVLKKKRIIQPNPRWQLPCQVQQSLPYSLILGPLHGILDNSRVQNLLSGLQGVQLQVRVTLFDISYRHFFGQTWKSPTKAVKNVSGQMPKVPFNEAIYFHTPLNHPNIVAVVEIVALAQKKGSSERTISCGFGIVRLFPGQSDSTQHGMTKQEKRLNLFHGTPRALLNPELLEPTEQSKFLTLIEGAHIKYSFCPHPALEQVMHLLPQNLLVSGSDTIPGVVQPVADIADCLREPRLQKNISCYLDKVSLSLYPTLDVFEEELLNLLNADRLTREDTGPDGNAVVIQERRLHVGVHNGWTFVAKPQVVVVEPVAEGLSRGRSGSFSIRRNSVTQSSSSGQQTMLLLRSQLHLNEMVKHPAFVITFQLEYVFSTVTGGDIKALASSKTAFMHSIRWAVWSPFEKPGNSEVCISLQGGPLPNPNNVMVYKTSGSESTTPGVKAVKGGVLKFYFIQQEGHPASPAHEMSQQKITQSPSQRRITSQLMSSPPETPPGPALSMSQLSTSPQYPKVKDTTRSQYKQLQRTSKDLPYVTSIVHLEADLSQSAIVPEPSEADQLQELPFAPVQAPVITLGPHISSSSVTMSRRSLAQFHTSGFPDILDCHNEIAEVTHPSDPVSFDPLQEEGDFLLSNEIVLQFLAFTRLAQEGQQMDWPKSIYFTFQFYRFPAVTTQRLLLVNPDGSGCSTRDHPPCVLLQVNKDGTICTGSPGLQLKYMVNPSFLKPGEKRCFIDYIAFHPLQIDVWDADSLLLIGSTSVTLKHLLRQGRPAVQVTHELDIVSTDYVQDLTAFRNDSLHQASVQPYSVSIIVKGRLNLRLGNVGHLADHQGSRSDTLPPSTSRVISAYDRTISFPGGSLSSLGLSHLNAKNTCRARRLADIDSELASMLCSRMKEANITLQHISQESDKIHQRKLERMMAVRQLESDKNQSEVKSYIMTRREERIQHLKDLQLIEAYRERSKTENITSMLSHAITTQHTIYASLGNAQFFEFALKNPFNVQHTITITCKDPELSVIVDSREWRYFKELTKTLTPLEEDMFYLKGNTLYPQVYLRPKETIYIPFKYQRFSADHTVLGQGPAGLPSSQSTDVALRQLLKDVQPKIIKIFFRTEDEKPLAICQVNVENTPHVIDQTFRFYHPELTFLKKSIRLPPWHTPPGAPAGMSFGEPQVHVRCSDPNVICKTHAMPPGEPQDVFLKVAAGPSPQIKKFFIIIYTDPWMAVPFQIWQLYIHFLQRIDVSCVIGQTSRLSLVLRGTQAVRKVRCYTSHPQELQTDPAETFVLPPGAVQDLHVRVCPRREGSKFIYLNVVDVDYHHLVASWLVCVSSRQPLISKAFEISIPVGGGKGSNKKITYTNPYPTRRAYFLRTNRSDLLQFKEDAFETGGGESYTIGLRFAPSQCPGVEEILIYINDQEDKNEETFCVKVIYF
ncbi:nephrocystin-4 isoform X1 [Polypterus senegalus]|uniref:nephrocystin-4 isoform X1 n=1 Tax=Polypterus senegalus TaxID=55291 RepID=UPI001964331D|nr:nephrocystin-4 isoform X1 [Polypterus senegalus]